MRRTTICLCLLFMLTACAPPGPVIGKPEAQPVTPTTPLDQPTAALEQIAEESRVSSEALTEPAAQLTITPLLDTSALLTLWNGNEHRYEIRLVDPATGQDVPGYTPIIVGKNTQFAPGPYTLSADGEKLAAIESQGESCEPSAGGSACRASADVLHLVDVRVWREVTTTLASGRGWVGPLVFSPDSTRLAMAYHEQKSSTLMLFDTAAGQLIGERTLEFRPSLIGYSQDGTALVAYGQPLGPDPGMSKPDPPHVFWMNAETLEVAWDQSLASILSGHWCLENCEASHEEQQFAYWSPAAALSPDGRKLYIVHAETERLTTVDFDARKVRSVEIRTARSWLESLLAHTASVAEAKGGLNGVTKEAALSPDGTQLYVLARTYSNDRWGASLGLQVIDVESGSSIAQRDGEGVGLKMTSDGAYLIVLNHTSDNRWWTDVLVAQNLQDVAQLEDWDVMLAQRMNGEPLFVARTILERPAQLAVLDPRSFYIIHTWEFNGYASWITDP